ncbi:ectoine/hydroxyectoine ABC transporter permease subunit EhuD, partial [Streptomyces sp. SID11233]|nr:ectoine/hydroxyectoine ABC transporter permease subunit EhuD [Streptomyces sp. SID11233]
MNYEWKWDAVSDSFPLLLDGFWTTLLATVLG